MKNAAIIITIVALLAFLGVKAKDSISVNVGQRSAKVQEETARETNNITEENNEGDVSVTVTPMDVRQDATNWTFDVSLNTHSAEINEDLMAVSELIDEQGRIYKPVSWEGSPPGGHHRSGVLKFSAPPTTPGSYELVIKQVGGVEERRFKWTF